MNCPNCGGHIFRPFRVPIIPDAKLVLGDRLFPGCLPPPLEVEEFCSYECAREYHQVYRLDMSTLVPTATPVWGERT